MESHAREIPLSRQMCASYDAYIASLPLILSRHNVDITRYAFDGEKHLHMDFVGAQLERPKFLEADGTSHQVGHLECLQRNLSYSLPLYTNVHVTLNGKKEIFESVYLGKIPLMVGSKHDPHERMCPHDPGGYFIVKGSEKTIVFQKAHIHNCPLTLHRLSNGVDSFAVCCKSEGEGVAVTTIKWNVVLW